MSTSSNDESLLAARLENLGLEESHPPDAASDLEDDIDMSPVSGSILTTSFLPSQGKAGNTPSRLPIPEETSHIVSSHTTEIIDLTTDASSESLEPHVCEARECAALKALQTTEILENILVYLPTAQLLPLQATSKQWSSLIRDSPTLRLHRFIHPLWPKSAFEFELLPLKMPGLDIRRGGPVHLGHWVEVQMTPRAAKRILQESKERSLLSMAPSSDPPLVPLPSYANLMITQPPITNMQAFLLRRRPPFPSKVPRKIPRTPSEEPLLKSKLSCDAGITLGFLADVARSILINASSGESDSVDRQVLFRAIVSFCQTDIAPRKRSGTRMVTALG